MEMEFSGEAESQMAENRQRLCGNVGGGKHRWRRATHRGKLLIQSSLVS